MKIQSWKVTLGISLVTATLLVGCGGSSSKTTKDNVPTSEQNSTDNVEHQENSPIEGTASNIPYLKNNHANYKEHGSNQTPAPVKDPVVKSINWTITATTEEGAEKLAEHIRFMEKQLQADRNPRGWDKLFLMEAYMKYNKYYTTNIERSGTNVVVSKQANTACAYEVISAHSDAVSGDFFARGDIMVNYSARADGILASSACNDVRVSLESYIASRQKRRGR